MPHFQTLTLLLHAAGRRLEGTPRFDRDGQEQTRPASQRLSKAGSPIARLKGAHHAGRSTEVVVICEF